MAGGGGCSSRLPARGEEGSFWAGLVPAGSGVECSLGHQGGLHWHSYTTSLAVSPPLPLPEREEAGTIGAGRACLAPLPMAGQTKAPGCPLWGSPELHGGSGGVGSSHQCSG